MSLSLRPQTYPYRPQRYHAWDVSETSPRVIFSIDSGTQILSIVNFSEQGLCFECPSDRLNLKVGDIIPSFQVVFGKKTFLTSPGKIKHVTEILPSGAWRYGLRFLEGRLNISEVFALRDQHQDQSSLVQRLRRIQRAPRYGQELLKQLGMEASFNWKGRKVPIKIENVSEFGFCFSLDGLLEVELFAGSLLQAGTILEEFSFLVDGKVLFEDQVRVIHSRKEQERLTVGVFCLGGASVPVSRFEMALKLRKIKKGFVEFLNKADQTSKIHPDFKIAINDFRYFLESMKSYLESAESDLEKLEHPQERQEALGAVVDFSERMLAERVKGLIEKMEKVVLQFNKEEDKIHRKYFQEQVLELTNGCLVFRRALEKPLGYPGDYQMMDAMYHRTKEGNNLWERIMSACLNGNTPGPQAVRNRARYLETKIAQTVAKHSDQETIHILSLACGPCEEVQRFLSSESEERKSGLHFYLLDQEEQALDFARKHLYPLASKFSSDKASVTFDFLQQGVKHLLKNPELVASYPKLDLIYTAGLFDYLPEPIAKQLTEVLLSMLSDEGSLVIGNFNKDYPSKFLIEYISDWFLLVRSPEEIMDFLPNDHWRSHATMEQEVSGVNLFLNVQKSLQKGDIGHGRSTA